MLSTSDFRKGTRIELDDQPWVLLDVASQSPSARGATTLIKTKMRNLVTGAFSARTFKSGERFPEPDLEKKDAVYLYGDGEHFHFMDNASFEQFALTPDEVGPAKSYLTENLEVKLQFYNERPIAVEVPSILEMVINECEPAVRGDTVNAVTKSATLETGLVIQVPMFVGNGERVKIDTREGRYLSRVR